MADVDDRWTRLDRVTGERVRTARYGTGKRWAARWRDMSGRQRSRSFAKKTDAERYLAGIADDLARGAYVDPRAGRITVRAYIETWMAQQTTDVATRERIAQQIRTQILPVLGDQELRSLRPSTIQAWLSALSRTYAPSTTRGALSTVSTVLTAAVEDRLIAENPCRSRAVRPPKLDDRRIIPWTHAQVSAVAAALPERYSAMVAVCAGLGLRQGELFGLAVEDVDHQRGIVHVRRQVKYVAATLYFGPPKRGKTRTVPLPETVAVALAEHVRVIGTASVTLPWLPDLDPRTAELFFTTKRHGALMRSVFNPRVWRPALRRAGVPEGREHGVHMLRHYYASALLADGVDVATLAAYLGHEHAAITLRYYCHLMPSAPGRVIAAVDRMFAKGGAPDVRQATR